MLYNRRQFIKRLGVIYGSVLLYSSCSSGNRYRVFTDGEAVCLIALCEQIIPADQDAGATDAGVIDYIDRQTYLRFPEELPLYRKGIASLQATCQVKQGKLFEEIEAETQIHIMKEMERSKLAEEYWKEVDQSSFFNLVLRRTMQGFYGSPRHGGNREFVSYKMMKLDYPLLIGQNRYRHEK